MTLPSIIDLEACTVRPLVSVGIGTADRFHVETMPMAAYGQLIWGWSVFAGPSEPPFPDGLVALVRWQNDEPVLLTLGAPTNSQGKATHYIRAHAFQFSYALHLVPTWHDYGFSEPG